MPSSYHAFINEVLDLYLEKNNKTVLDIGIGFGKWGHLFREYGDVFQGRLTPREWVTEIHGVEIFEKYITQLHRYVYDVIMVGSIAKIAGALPDYDFVFAGDVIEHMEKDVALYVLEQLKRKCRRVVISIPLGLEWNQGEVFGNEAERHLSVWNERDFEDWKIKIIKVNPKNKPIGLFASC